jgi:hypothetical protein
MYGISTSDWYGIVDVPGSHAILDQMLKQDDDEEHEAAGERRRQGPQ